MVRSAARARYTSAAQRLMQAELVPNKGCTDADIALGRCLTSLGKCAPLDDWTGEVPRSGLRLQEYLALVEPRSSSADAAQVCERLGLDAASWLERGAQSGLFQGVGAGRDDARRHFAAQQGKRTLADKTGIWNKK